MTDSTPLSPAAQAVSDAVMLKRMDNSPVQLPTNELIAAALRAAAQFNPGPFVPELFGEGWNAAMGELRNIAAELDGTNSPSENG